ncbi:MAG: hypothetical protein WAO35_20125 [Terriglobia bacterium]
MDRPGERAWFGVCYAMVWGVALLIGAPSKVRADSRTPSAPVVEAARVQAAGTLSAHAVRRDGRVRLWLTVSNPTPGSIRDVWLLLPLEAPDYEITGIYKWSQGPGPTAAPSPLPLGAASANLIANELCPGDSITVWADFLPRQSHESRTLNALVSWKSEVGSPSQISVALGDLQVPGRWDAWRESVVYQVVKDFALPLVILLLPFLIQRMAQKRAHLAETWNLMLPDSHHTTMTYYMPLQASLAHALDELGSYSKATDSAKKTAHARALFFHFFMFLRRLKHAGDKLSGFYFKDRTGERLAVACLQQVDKLYPGTDEADRVETAQVLRALRINETLDSFLEKLDGNPQKPRIDKLKTLFQKRWQHFYGPSAPAGVGTQPVSGSSNVASAPGGGGSAPTPSTGAVSPAPAPAKSWLESDSSKDAVLYLKAFSAIIEYEMNRPYEHWYGEREVIHLDAQSEPKLKELAQETARRENIPEFPRQVRKYLRKGKKKTGWLRKLAASVWAAA